MTDADKHFTQAVNHSIEYSFALYHFMIGEVLPALGIISYQFHEDLIETPHVSKKEKNQTE